MQRSTVSYRKLRESRAPLIGNHLDGSPFGWGYPISYLLLGVILSLVVTGIAIGVSIGSWVADGSDRELVAAERSDLNTANDCYLTARNAQQESENQKESIAELNAELDAVEANVTETTQLIADSGAADAEALYSAINQSIADAQSVFDAQIDALNVQLSVILSQSNAASTLVRSGTCTVHTASTSYELRTTTAGGLTLPFYVFAAMNTTVDLGNGSGGFTVGPCAPSILNSTSVTVSGPLVAEQIAGQVELLAETPGFFGQTTAGLGTLVLERATTSVGVQESAKIGDNGMTYFPSL